MDKNLFFKSNGGNNYFYSDEMNTILFIPPLLKDVLLNNYEKSDCRFEYYKNKYEFLSKSGLLKNEKIDFVLKINSDDIKKELANTTQLLIEVTDDCNLNCKYCAYGELYNDYDERKSCDQSFNRVKLLVDFLKKLWESPYNISHDNVIDIAFYGGEPLLNMKLIKEVILYLENLNLSFLRFNYRMTTNGLLLNRYMDYLYEKNFSLTISLDGDEEANLYRMTKKGSSSFKIVADNIKRIRSKYLEYYDKNVGIHSVLHNKNNYKDVFLFIESEFNKKPSISALNHSGVRLDKRNLFLEMYNDVMLSYKNALLHEGFVKSSILENPETLQLDSMLLNSIGNSFYSYSELLSPHRIKKYIPTGTCFPFSKRIFLTVNGKILPCERIGQELSLGTVMDDSIDIDFEYVSEVYKHLFEQVIHYCRSCQKQTSCGQCVFFITKYVKNGRVYCPYFVDKKNATKMMNASISYVENNPSLYEQLCEQNKYL